MYLGIEFAYPFFHEELEYVVMRSENYNKFDRRRVCV